MSASHDRYMALALSLGRRGQGRTWPNPAVGCVIVAHGRIVGRGVTGDGGRPHAEVRALAQAGAAAQGATAYVSLEPCAHHGKTPPCADALIAAGIACVVAPFDDEDPRVAGQGFARLRAAGIEVITGVRVNEAARDHEGFVMRTVTGRPRITLKLATSFDGRIATAGGDSKWITGPEARRLTHAMRARHDAVMVGAGTARADDPALTVRDMGVSRQPVRVVLSRWLDLPLGGTLARSAAEVPLWLLHGHDADAGVVSAWRGLGARLIPVAQREGRIDAQAALRALGEAGLTRVFCEGGGALAASLLRADLVDELVGFGAGMCLGADGRAAVAPLGLGALSEAARFDLDEVRAVGGDVMQRWLRAVG